MGEITDFVTLYIEESDILEDKANKISVSLEDNIKDVIAPGKVGYDHGYLHDSVEAWPDVISNTEAWITGTYHRDYGKYWYRWKDGVDFLEEGLNKTLELYR